MSKVIPDRIRAIGRKTLGSWHYFYDWSRAKWRGLRDSRKALKDATLVVRDVCGIRFAVSRLERSNLPVLLRHPNDCAELAALPHLLMPGHVAFDVGANLGLYSVLLSRLCGTSGQVWAFEPAPDTYWRLRETLALNRCENVNTVRAAVLERSGSARMNVFEANFGEWSTLGMPAPRSENGRRVPSQPVDVPCVSLDEFCDTHGVARINFLKVDVEGFELAVFRGAERLLKKRHVDYICFEVAEGLLRAAGFECQDVFEFLQMHGYRLYRFDKARSQFIGPVQGSSAVWTNFFASWKDLSALGGADAGAGSNQERPLKTLAVEDV